MLVYWEVEPIRPRSLSGSGCWSRGNISRGSNRMSRLMISPLELLEKLAALFPLLRLHLLCCHGVLVSRVWDRDRIVLAYCCAR